MADNAPNIRFGKNARMYIALDDGSGVEPADAAFVYFCATSQIEIGGKKGTETVNNFCTGGNDVNVNDGSETYTLTTGDATWAENDAAINLLETAYNTDARVHYRIYPLGKGAGQPAYRGTLDVNEWKLTIPSKGLIKMTNGLNPLGKPEKGTVDGAGAFTAVGYSLVGAPLADNAAANLPALAAGQAVNYKVTTAAVGDMSVTVAGASAPRTVTILDNTGAQKATGTDTATFTAAPIGTYTVRVTGVAASTGGTITVDWA